VKRSALRRIAGLERVEIVARDRRGENVRQPVLIFVGGMDGRHGGRLGFVVCDGEFVRGVTSNDGDRLRQQPRRCIVGAPSIDSRGVKGVGDRVRERRRLWLGRGVGVQRRVLIRFEWRAVRGWIHRRSPGGVVRVVRRCEGIAAVRVALKRGIGRGVVRVLRRRKSIAAVRVAVKRGVWRGGVHIVAVKRRVWRGVIRIVVVKRGVWRDGVHLVAGQRRVGRGGVHIVAVKRRVGRGVIRIVVVKRGVWRDVVLIVAVKRRVWRGVVRIVAV
jgi:hypothetical protein